MAAPTTVEPTLTRPPDQQPVIAKLWILHGAAWLALIVYCWTMWVVSGDFTPNTLGRGQEPVLVRGGGPGRRGALRRPRVRLDHLALHPHAEDQDRPDVVRRAVSPGRLADVLPGAVDQLDHLPVPVRHHVRNTGSWLRHIPGWSSPNAELIPVPWVYGMAYLWMCGLLSYASSRYMARQRRKDPTRGAVRLILQTYALMIGVDIVMELIMTRLGLISYSATIPALTLWAGTDHQFPLYEPFSWAGTFVAFGSLHFFRDDKGRSLVERGVDKLRFRNEGTRTFARFLALIGGAQLASLITFNIPYWFYALHAGPMPQPHIEREWRNGGVCGPKTAYDCPHPLLPIARDSSPTNRIDLQEAGPR